MSRRVLVVAPHADDEVLGCGGSIARHAAEGDEVRVHVVTRGVPELFSDDYMEAVRKEALAAHDRLGVVDTVFSDFPAPMLDQTPAYVVADAIASTANDWSAQIAYVPFRGDVHIDHRVVFDACMVAFRPRGSGAVSRVLAYETLSETEWAPPLGDQHFVPNVFVDVAEYLEDKLAAMRLYDSQLQEFPAARSLEAIESLASYRGATIGATAAESFMLMRDVVR